MFMLKNIKITLKTPKQDNILKRFCIYVFKIVLIHNLFYDRWDTALVLGWEYGAEFNGIILCLNPYIRFNLIGKDYANIQSGINLGIGYKF